MRLLFLCVVQALLAYLLTLFGLCLWLSWLRLYCLTYVDNQAADAHEDCALQEHSMNCVKALLGGVWTAALPAAADDSVKRSIKFVHVEVCCLCILLWRLPLEYTAACEITFLVSSSVSTSSLR